MGRSRTEYDPRVVRTGPSPGVSRRHIGVSLVLLCGLVAAACDGGPTPEPPSSTKVHKPDAEAYSTALATILDDRPVPEDERTVVFLVPLGDDLGIETQAAVIDSFTESYDIRFVDDLAAAVDGEDPAHPPREEGIVLGIGTIDRVPPHVVRLERYRSVDDVDATLLTLEFRHERWRVAMTDQVPAEVLIDAL